MHQDVFIFAFGSRLYVFLLKCDSLSWLRLRKHLATALVLHDTVNSNALGATVIQNFNYMARRVWTQYLVRVYEC